MLNWSDGTSCPPQGVGCFVLDAVISVRCFRESRRATMSLSCSGRCGIADHRTDEPCRWRNRPSVQFRAQICKRTERLQPKCHFIRDSLYEGGKPPSSPPPSSKSQNHQIPKPPQLATPSQDPVPMIRISGTSHIKPEHPASRCILNQRKIASQVHHPASETCPKTSPDHTYGVCSLSPESTALATPDHISPRTAKGEGRKERTWLWNHVAC